MTLLSFCLFSCYYSCNDTHTTLVECTLASERGEEKKATCCVVVVGVIINLISSSLSFLGSISPSSLPPLRTHYRQDMTGGRVTGLLP